MPFWVLVLVACLVLLVGSFQASWYGSMLRLWVVCLALVGFPNPQWFGGAVRDKAVTARSLTFYPEKCLKSSQYCPVNF